MCLSMKGPSKTKEYSQSKTKLSMMKLLLLIKSRSRWEEANASTEVSPNFQVTGRIQALFTITTLQKSQSKISLKICMTKMNRSSLCNKKTGSNRIPLSLQPGSLSKTKTVQATQIPTLCLSKTKRKIKTHLLSLFINQIQSPKPKQYHDMLIPMTY